MTTFNFITNYLLTMLAIVVAVLLGYHRNPWVFIFIYWCVVAVKNYVNWMNELVNHE